MVLASASFGKIDRWEWFRWAAFLNAAGQLIYLWPVHSAQSVALGFAILLLIVIPWIFTRWSFIWWPSYAFLIYITYPVGREVCSFWAQELQGHSPFIANPLWFQAMMIYGTFLFLFLTAQIIALPFYRKHAVAAARLSTIK